MMAVPRSGLQNQATAFAPARKLCEMLTDLHIRLTKAALVLGSEVTAACERVWASLPNFKFSHGGLFLEEVANFLLLLLQLSFSSSEKPLGDISFDLALRSA